MIGIESLLQVYCPGMAVRLLRPYEIEDGFMTLVGDFGTVAAQVVVVKVATGMNMF